MDWNPKGAGIAVAANQGVTLHLVGAAAQPRKVRWKGSSLVLRWSPDAKFIATGEQNATVHFCFVDSNRDAEIRGYSTKVQELAWDSSGGWLATGGGPTIVLWDCSGEGPTGREPVLCEARSSKLTQLAFQPGGEFLASADVDGFLFLWDPTNHDKVIGGVLLSSPASCLRWCEDDRIAVGQEDGKVVVFRLQAVAKRG